MKVDKIFKKIKNQHAKIAIILGSGLTNLIPLEKRQEFSYKSLGLDFENIQGHSRSLVFGEFKSIPVVIMSRIHFYENGEVDDKFALFEAIKKVGVETIIATTSVGGISEKAAPGKILLIKDHVNLTSINPLIGHKPLKFVDMTNAYDKDLRNMVKEVAKQDNISLEDGVHFQLNGPTYETPTEVKMCKILGADTVSMSTVLENIIARYLDIKFVGFACVSNKAASEDCEPLCHEDVLKNSVLVKKNLQKLILGTLISWKNMHKNQ